MWEAAENAWKKSRGVKALLLVGSTAAVLVAAAFFLFSDLYPGIAIGLLALVAGIVSLRTEGMGFPEKVAWMLILVAFAVLEVLAIGKSERKSTEEAAAQNKKLVTIVSNLGDVEGKLKATEVGLSAVASEASLAAENSKKQLAVAQYLIRANETEKRKLRDALCVSIDDILTDPKVNGMGSFQRVLGKYVYVKGSEGEKRELQNEADAYFRSRLQPDLKALNSALKVALGTSWVGPRDSIQEVIDGDGWGLDQISSAMNELRGLRETAGCPAMGRIVRN